MKPFHLFYFFAVVGALYAESVVPPEKPIHVVTEINQVSTQGDGLRLVVSATLTTNQISISTQISTITGTGGVWNVEAQELRPMVKILEEASIAAQQGKPFTGQAGLLSVIATTDAGKKTLLLKIARNDQTIPPSELVVDLNSARQLTRALAQCKQVMDWFSTKLRLLQPEIIIR